MTVMPAIGWFLFFLFIPLMIVVIYSVQTRGPYGGVVFRLNVQNFVAAADWIYLRIFWSSLKLASLTTVSCLLIGYPMAYVIATSSVWLRSMLLMAVIVPFWTNF